MNDSRLIVDTNQASSIHRHQAPQDYDPIIIIPPLTWAEILNSPPHHALERVKALAQYKVLFGMDLTPIHNNLVRMTEKEIESFEPIYPTDSDDHLLRILTLREPTPQHFDRATDLKQQSADQAASIERFFAESKKQAHGKKSKGEVITRVKYTDLNDALQHLFYGAEPTYRAGFVQMVTENGKLPLKSKSSESFFDAVLKNPMLRRCLRLHAVISLGYADVWGDNRLNVSVSQNRNDVADIHLALYARDGDTILSNDRNLQRAFRHADSKGAVRFATWEEMIASHNR